MAKRPRGRGAEPRSPAASGARVVSATETAKNFGAIIDRVREERAVYVVERGGTPVAEISPVKAKTVTIRDFVEIVRSGSVPSPGEDYLEAVEEGIALYNRPEVPENRWGP
ncbi:MAG: hypothetical protein OXG35_20400 [Acidobacteria bacterium]|nr:hypothetical protein [Acidobacteriota bacterium]